MSYVFNDGGRATAGYKGTTGDCAVRAVAIATEQPYQTVYDTINAFVDKHERMLKRRRRKSHARTGVHSSTMRRFMATLGWRWVPTMQIGSGCKTHLCAEELPGGRVVVQVSHHYTAMVGGVIHDIYDPRRDGGRCVYGFFVKD